MSGKNYIFGDYFLDTGKRELFSRNRSVDVSVKAFDILEFLVENRDKIVTKEELFDSVWSDSFVEESNLPVHISALRRSLGERRGETKYIKTIFGSGYKFIAPVKEIAETSNQNTSENGKNFSSFADENSPENSLAVLPFLSLDDDAEIEYLAEGITQDLINQLAQSSELKVMAFSAVKNYRGSKLDLQEIGFQMNVDKILSATVREFKDTLDVNVELINVRDKTLIWGMRHNCRLDDVFSVRKELSENIFRNLQINKNGRAAESKQKEINAEAYNLYLKGLYILTNFANSEDRRKSLDSALKLFQQAVKKDSAYALAHIAIGKIHFFQYNNDFIPKAEAFSLCRTALQRAVVSDPQFSEAFVLEGMMKMFFEFDFAAANECFIKALKLNPNDAYAFHMQSLVFIITERFDDAIEAQNRAIRLDPTSSPYNSGLINRFFFTGNLNRAITHAEETIEMNERAVPAYLILALSYAVLGIYDEALKAIRKAREFSVLPEYILSESYILAAAGETKKARKILAEVSTDKYTVERLFSEVAVIHHALGEEEKAIDVIEHGCQNDYLIKFLLKCDPRLQSLKQNPRFISVLKDISECGTFPAFDD